MNGTLLKTIQPPQTSEPIDIPTFFLIRVDAPIADPIELREMLLNSAPEDGENGAAHHVSSQEGLNVLTAIAHESTASNTVLGANFIVTFDELSDRTTNEAPTGTGGSDYTPDAFQWPYMNRGSAQDIGAAEAARLIHDAGRVPSAENRVRFLIMDGGFGNIAELPPEIIPQVPSAFPIQTHAREEIPAHGTAPWLRQLPWVYSTTAWAPLVRPPRLCDQYLYKVPPQISGAIWSIFLSPFRQRLATFPIS
ncbi:MAG: hypothetical protein R3C68_03120 [Myxococcota bacterium]